LADELKKAIIKTFPIVKIFLKPLVFDIHDKGVESTLMRKKIGDF